MLSGLARLDEKIPYSPWSIISTGDPLYYADDPIRSSGFHSR